MHSSSLGSRIAQRIKDILAAISAIERFISDVDYSTFQFDLKTKSAVERQLLIVAEAMGRLVELEQDLPEDQRFESRFPGINVRQIRGMGNRLRHEYGNVDEDIVWATVTGPDLKELREVLLAHVNEKSKSRN